jgi:hypothetical protein
LPSEKGSFHFRATSEGGRQEHVIVIFQYGTATAVNVVPAIWEQIIPLPYVDLIVSGIPSGTVIALRYAVQLPSLTGKRGKKTAASASTDEKIIAVPGSVAARLPVNKQGQVSLIHHTDYFHFSDVMYYRIP